MGEGRRHTTTRAATAERLEARQLLSASPPSPPVMQASPAHQDVTASPAFTAGANGPFGFSPAQVRGAYGLDSVSFDGVVGDGSGQTIAIIVAYDDPAFVNTGSGGFAASDLHLFDQQFGLPDPPSFTKVSQAGSTVGLPGTDPTGSWENEAALDVEWAHAAAPAANLLLVECNSGGLDDLIQGGVQYARQQPGVSVVSMSFAAPEAASELSYDPYLVTPGGHAGVTFVAAAGDTGTPAEYPAASPTVIGVGGTTATLAGNIYSSEAGLSNGGGGVSLYEPKPAYQSALTQSTTHRLTPDVAFEANHFTNGNDVYDSYNGGSADPWYAVGGTSVAAPVWAGLIAMADQGRARLGLRTLNAAGSTLPRLYYLPQSDFHDVTTGNNGSPAGTGFDLVTGRGTPIANRLVPDLAGGASITGTVYVDANANATLDAGEVGLSGAVVYLDLSGTGTVGGIDPVVYSTAGAFAFNDLPGGTYRLAALPYTSYAPTTAAYYTVTVGYNATVNGELIGQRPRHRHDQRSHVRGPEPQPGPDQPRPAVRLPPRLPRQQRRRRLRRRRRRDDHRHQRLLFLRRAGAGRDVPRPPSRPGRPLADHARRRAGVCRHAAGHVGHGRHRLRPQHRQHQRQRFPRRQRQQRPQRRGTPHLRHRPLPRPRPQRRLHPRRGRLRPDRPQTATTRSAASPPAPTSSIRSSPPATAGPATRPPAST